MSKSAAQVHDQEVGVAVGIDVARRHAHAGLGDAVLVHRAAAERGFLQETKVPRVHPQLVDRHVVGDEQVDAPVAVEVRGRGAKAVAEGEAKTGRGGHVGEGAVAVVAEQLVRCRGVVVLRRTVGDHAILIALHLHRHAPANVVDDEQVQIAVGVEVRKDRRGAQARVGDPRLRGDVLEAAFAVVAQQRIGVAVGDVEVDVAVAVVVAGRGAEAVAPVFGTRALRCLEAACSIVDVEPIAVFRARVQAAALHQVGVQVAVVVDVGQHGAAVDGLRQQVYAVMAGAMQEVDAPVCGLLLEPGLVCACGRIGGSGMRATRQREGRRKQPQRAPGPAHRRPGRTRTEDAARHDRSTPAAA